MVREAIDYSEMLLRKNRENVSDKWLSFVKEREIKAFQRGLFTVYKTLDGDDQLTPMIEKKKADKD